MAREIRRVIRGALISVSLALALDACSLLGTDVSDRINSFIVALNSSDRSNINSNFDQTTTTLDATFWSTSFPYVAGYSYSVTLIDYSNPSNVTATIMGPPQFNLNTGLPISAVFVMNKTGMDWYIAQLSLNGSGTPLIY